MILSYNKTIIKRRFLFSLCLVSLFALPVYAQQEEPDENNAHTTEPITEEEREISREIDDFLETLDPEYLQEAQKNEDQYIALLRKPLAEILDRRGQKCNGIVRYSAKRDKAGILKLFQNIWYWMVATGAEFSPEKFLTTGDKELRGKNKEDAKIFVYCVHGDPVAFVAYYEETPPRKDPRRSFKGMFRFVSLNLNERQAVYAEELMKFALADMKRMGLMAVELTTRTDNLPAIALYTKLGFFEVEKNDLYVDYAKFLV